MKAHLKKWKWFYVGCIVGAMIAPIVIMVGFGAITIY